MRASSAPLASWVVRPASTAFACSRCSVALALAGGGQVHVGEDDVDPGSGGDVGDPGPHHPGTDYSQPRGPECGLPRRAAGAGLDLLQVEEVRLDPVLRDLPGNQPDEVAGLDQRRCVQIHLRTLHGRGQYRPGRGRRCSGGLAAQIGREIGQLRGQRPASGGAAGYREPGPVPGLAWLGVLGDPLLRARQELVDPRDKLVDQPQLESLGWTEPLPGQQHLLQPGRDPEAAHHAHHSAAGGQEPQPGLRQAELAARHIRDDPVVAGQRQLQAAAERGPVDRRHHRLAQGLQRAQLRLDAIQVRREPGRVGGLQAQQLMEVTAGEERLLRRGEHHPGDVFAFPLEPRDGVAQRGHEPLGQRVGGLGRVVHGEDDDAVRVGLPADDLGVGHGGNGLLG